MAATIYDVARDAGVSPRTVANVVSGHRHVSDAMRARVQRSIDRLGYRPNLVARGLRSGKTGTITLALPDLNVPYFAELAGEIIERLAESSYQVNVRQTASDPESERSVLAERLQPRMSDGMIFSPIGLPWQELSERAAESRQPLVLLGEQVRDGQYDRVLVDNVAAARTATEHLLSLGRRRIAAIGVQPGAVTETPRLRVEGYRAALARAGLTADSRLEVPTAEFRREEGRRGMEQLLALPERPDAVFAFNDLLAEGAIRAILSAGLRVPEDIAVIGYDGNEQGAFGTPSLSTIAPDLGQIGRLAVERVMVRIAGDTTSPVSLEVPFALIARESTLGSTTVSAG